MEPPLFYDGAEALIRVLVGATVLYLAVILFIRVTGKRSTSQMNNFDWVVTVALGSLIASGIVLDDVTVAETLLAVAWLLGLQWLLTKLIFHSGSVSRLVKAEPTLLVHRGKFLCHSLASERVTEEEVLAAIREKGLLSVGDVDCVVLETDATMSVIAKSRHGTFPAADCLGTVRAGCGAQGALPFRDYPHRMDDAGEVSGEREQDIEPEMQPEADL